MKYYIFKVKPSIGKEYYVINNCYLGYLGLDCGENSRIRSILEYNAKITRQYQLFASGEVSNPVHNNELHKLFCGDRRLYLSEIKLMVKKYKLKLSRDKSWYEIFYPNPNCSESKLKRADTKAKIAKLKEEALFNE